MEAKDGLAKQCMRRLILNKERAEKLFSRVKENRRGERGKVLKEARMVMLALEIWGDGLEK